MCLNHPEAIPSLCQSVGKLCQWVWGPLLEHVLFPKGQWWGCFMGFLSVGPWGGGWNSRDSGAAVMVMAPDLGVACSLLLPSWIEVVCSISAHGPLPPYWTEACAQCFSTWSAVTTLHCSDMYVQDLYMDGTPRWCAVRHSLFTQGALVWRVRCRPLLGPHCEQVKLD